MTRTRMSPEHPFRLKSLTVKNFKSVREANVEFTPLTLLVGSNSSGKSSLIQPILALAQNVRSRSRGYSFLLNSEYRQLGKFGDMAYRDGEVKADSVEITVCLNWSRRRLRHLVRDPEATADARSRIEWNIGLTQNPGMSAGTAHIEHLRVNAEYYEKATDDTARRQAVSCSLIEIGQALSLDDAEQLTIVRTPYGARDEDQLIRVRGDYVVDIEGYGSHDERDARTCDAVALRGGLPQAVYVEQPLWQIIGRLWWNTAQVFFSELVAIDSDDGSSQVDLRAVDQRDLDEAVKLASTELRKYFAEVDSDDPRPEHYQLATGMERYRFYRDLEQLAQDDQDGAVARAVRSASLQDFLSSFREQTDDVVEAQEEVLIAEDESWRPISVSDIYGDLTDFFSQGIKCLDPIRVGPQVLYTARRGDLELGLGGEFTASVLLTYPEHPITPIDENSPDSPATLKEALIYWLRRLDLASTVHLSDEAQLGIRLEIEMVQGGGRFDMTAVGVGVSQILPVLVQCILTEPGQTIVLEQPELHLHPALQQRLGDFLVDCVLSGRQLIVETHSEHLINRVRRRFAEDPDGMRGLATLLFVEQQKGATVIQSVDLDDSTPSRDSWPRGFFDVASREAQSLVSEHITSMHSDDGE